MESDGEFVIVWNNSNGTVSDTESYIRFDDTNGSAKGAKFQIHTTTTDSQAGPRVAINPVGNRCVAVFEGTGSGDNNGAYFRWSFP